MEAADLHNYCLLGCHVCSHTARYQRFGERSLVQNIYRTSRFCQMFFDFDQITRPYNSEQG